MVRLDQLEKRHKEICQQALEIVSKRGNEYSVPRDTLKTFRQTSEMMSMEASWVADTLICIKVARMLNNPDLHMDSVLDCINYLVYKVVLMEEDQAEKASSG